MRNHPVGLGDTSFTIQVSVYDSSNNVTFVHLHDDEQTAKQATHNFLELQGGTLVSIQNGGQRLVKFTKKGVQYTFDPNRIFTRKGIIESLKLFQPNYSKAVPEVERFASQILKNIPNHSYIIAVHNNTDNRYSILSYLPKGELPAEAEKVHISNKMDPDDFVYTSDPYVFNQLEQQDINVVLQKKKPFTDDGSLSILFGRKRKAYTNVESEHGHLDVQLQLIKAVVDIVIAH